MTEIPAYGEPVRWRPEKPRWRLWRFLLSWFAITVAVLVAGLIVPGFNIETFGGALGAALIISVLNALVPPLIAAVRLPFALVSGFLVMLFLNAYLLLLAEEISNGAHEVDSFWAALGASLVMSATLIVLEVVLGTNDDATFNVKVIRRVAGRQGTIEPTDVPGIIHLEIDGLALPVLRRAMRDGHAPNMANWLADKSHKLLEWETDLSSQTGASQAGILLGSNRDIPAFRWVEKDTGKTVACSGPSDCEEIEGEHATGIGLLTNGGASRGNLLSGEADEVILTVSRMAAEFEPNPGYRAFYSNGYNATRTLVLVVWELVLEWSAALRASRRNVRPRGHRGGIYPFMRAGLCVFVRDLIVHGVLTDMMRGQPIVYATFSSYDEVAHHSGLERSDTMEALRKVDQAFGHIERARRYAPRPYHIVVLSDHGQTQGATFKQRNGYGLDELVRGALDPGSAVVGGESGDETNSMVGHALDEATGRAGRKAEKEEGKKPEVSRESAVVMGSGNLGLVYLMDEPRRLTMEEIDARHPRLLPALREHEHIGWLLVRSEAHGAVALGGDGLHYLEDGSIEGNDPLAAFSPDAPRHLLRTDGFRNVADVMVGSFYDPVLEEGCAFEELISFHGGLGGPQTKPFVLYPSEFPVPSEKIVGAEAVHGLLRSWRRQLQGEDAVARVVEDRSISDETATAPVARPIGVTIVAVVALLQALVAVAAGVFLFVQRNDASLLADLGRTSSEVVGTAVVLVALGALTLVVGLSLWRGHNWARIVIALVELAHLGFGIFLTVTHDGGAFFNGVWEIAVALLVLVLLYGGRSDRYFRRRSPRTSR